MITPVYARDTTVLTLNGAPVMVTRGEHWDADDPIVLAFPDRFSASPLFGLRYTGNPPAEMLEPPVEQATAGPGERRNVRRG